MGGQAGGRAGEGEKIKFQKKINIMGGGGMLGRGRGENKVSKKNWDEGWERAKEKSQPGMVQGYGVNQHSPVHQRGWMVHIFGLPFTPYPLFQWYPQSKDILLNLSMKCSNSLRNAETQHLFHKVRD